MSCWEISRESFRQIFALIRDSAWSFRTKSNRRKARKPNCAKPLIQTVADIIETFDGSFSRDKFALIFVNIRSQKICRLRIGTRDESGRHAADISRKSCAATEFLNRFGSRH